MLASTDKLQVLHSNTAPLRTSSVETPFVILDPMLVIMGGGVPTVLRDYVVSKMESGAPTYIACVLHF